MKLKYLPVLFVSALVYYGCEDIRSYPSVPEIEGVTYTVTDSLDALGNRTVYLNIRLKFADGDGNLSTPGERPLTSFPPDSTHGDTIYRDTTTYSKIFLTFFEKKYGNYIPAPSSDFLTPPVFIIPYGQVMERTGQNKLIKGTIEIHYPFTYPIPTDTLMVKLYITDLSYNKSNTDSISEIVLTAP